VPQSTDSASTHPSYWDAFSLKLFNVRFKNSNTTSCINSATNPNTTNFLIWVTIRFTDKSILLEFRVSSDPAMVLRSPLTLKAHMVPTRHRTIRGMMMIKTSPWNVLKAGKHSSKLLTAFSINISSNTVTYLAPPNRWMNAAATIGMQKHVTNFFLP